MTNPKNVLPEACEVCDSTGGLYLHGRCHPTSKTWAVIFPDNTLIVECGECGAEVARFKALELHP